MHSALTKTQWYLPLVLLIASLFLFWNLGVSDVIEFDEARNGVNAWYMYYNHDYFNNYYAHEVDTWNVKPPLLTWLIVGSYKLFGLNEFALRFAPAVCAFLFFIVFYRLVKMLSDDLTAFISCIILLACRAIASYHVGRSGDFDSLLLLFLTCSAYSLCFFLYRNKTYGIYLVGIFTGLAFYSKGTAGILYLPGLFLFILLSGQFARVFKSIHTYLSFALMVLIAGSWIWLSMTYGKSYSGNSFYGTGNNIETMFFKDTYQRLMIKDPHFNTKSDVFFFFHTIEFRMNMWHILYYIALATGIVLLCGQGKNFFSYIWQSANILPLLAMCLSLPIILVLSFSQQAMEWYLTPVWPSVAIIVAIWMVYAAKRRKFFVYIWLLVIGFNLVKHFLYINSEPRTLHHTLQKSNPSFQTDYIVLTQPPRQNLMLYIHWLGLDFHKAETGEQLSIEKGRTAIVNTLAFDDTRFERIAEFDEYTLARVR